MPIATCPFTGTTENSLAQSFSFPAIMEDWSAPRRASSSPA